MPNKIIHLRSNTTDSIPTTSSLGVGEIAINIPDGKMYIQKSGSAGRSIETVIVSNSTSSIGTLTLISSSLIISGSPSINSGTVLDLSGTTIDFDFDTLSFSGSFESIGNSTFTGSVSITGSTQGGGSGHILTYNTSSGLITYTTSSAITLTTLGTSGAATLVANTLNIPQYASGGGGTIYKSTVDTGAFLSTSSIAVYTQLIPANTYGIGDILRVTYRSRKTGTAGIQIMRIYVNTTADLLGSPILVGQYRGSAVNTILQMLRHLAIKSSTANTEVLSSATTGAPTDFAQDVPSTLVIDWTATKYFVFALQNASALDTNYGSMFLIEKL
jgi:hypothetical protein